MNTADIVGIIAAVLTTSAFVPQAMKVVRTRETAAISLAMYTMFTVGVALWLVFGVLTTQWAIVAANGVTLVFALVIVVVKLGEPSRDPR